MMGLNPYLKFKFELNKDGDVSQDLLLKMGQSRPLFLFIFVFSTCHNSIFLFDKSVDGLLRIRTQGGRMEGADESTELRRHP